MTPLQTAPCLGRLDAACFKHNPKWARRAFAYRLLHTLFPGYITRRLPKGLRLALIGSLADIPPGVIIPDGTVIAPGAEIPPGYQPGDPPPDGWIPAPPPPPDTGGAAPIYNDPFVPGPTPPPGGGPVPLPPPGPTSGTYYSVASGDDGTWKPGWSFKTNEYFLYFGFAVPYKANCWMTFHGIQAPQGATITAAKITFHSGQTAGSDIVDVMINGNAVDNPTNPTDTDEANGLALTYESVAWDPGDWVLDDYYDTPDLKLIVQEITDRPLWVPGNNILIVIKATATSEAYRAPGSWDGVAFHDIPALYVEWTA